MDALDKTEPGHEAADVQRFEITTSRQFTGWLLEQDTSLALTTYQTGKLLLIGSNPETQRLAIFERTIDRPMGLAVREDRFALAALTQIYQFSDCLEGSVSSDGHDALFVPQVAYYTGDLDVHDVGYGRDGEIYFVNTLFGCIATVSTTHSFAPYWKPPFISRLAAEDRCHLNGMAMDGAGLPAYVTAVSQSDVADGWRDNRRSGGVVVDVKSHEIVCSGLSMPHSPRWHNDKLWVLNSGTGEFGYVDLESGKFEPIAFCPGYLRGLSFIGNYAIVGISEARENRTFEGLELQERLTRQGVEPRCGLCVIDLTTGDIVHWLRLSGLVNELYDVAAMPGVTKPALIGFKSQEIRRTISIGPANQ